MRKGTEETRNRRLAVGAVVVYAVLAAFLSAAMAEPVGLDARGMDPWTALRHASRYDVRDALNRPVSAEKIGAGLKEASTRRAEDVSFASRLPISRRLIRLLEGLTMAAAALAAPLKGGPPAWAVSWLPPASKLIALLILASGVPALKTAAVQGRDRGPAHPAQGRTFSLRC